MIIEAAKASQQGICTARIIFAGRRVLFFAGAKSNTRHSVLKVFHLLSGLYEPINGLEER